MRSLKKFQSDSGVAAHPGVGGNYGVCCLGCVSALLGRYDAAHLGADDGGHLWGGDDAGDILGDHSETTRQGRPLWSALPCLSLFLLRLRMVPDQ